MSKGEGLGSRQVRVTWTSYVTLRLTWCDDVTVLLGLFGFTFGASCVASLWVPINPKLQKQEHVVLLKTTRTREV